MKLRHLPALALLLVVGPAAAAPHVQVDLVASQRGDIPTDRAVNAVLGEAVTLWVVVSLRDRGATQIYSDAPRFELRGRLHSGRRVRSLRALSPSLSWSRVEPLPHHVSLPPPNAGNATYSNAILFGPRHGAWLGYDRIEYKASVIRGATASSLVVQRTASYDARAAAGSATRGAPRGGRGPTASGS